MRAPAPIDAAPSGEPPARYDPEVALPWVISMRWVAVTGQALTVLFATILLDIDLPIGALAGVMAVTFLTNVALRMWQARTQGTPQPRLLPAILTLDTLLLTAMLALSGGPRNPFTSLYVVHVALAAVALSPAWTWWTVGLSGLCYGFLYQVHVPLEFTRGGFDLPLQAGGLGLSVLLVAAVTAYFTSGVTQALRRREAALRKAEARVARNEWLASLAALAAGTTHELGTPLGTIAIVSKELERAAERLGEGDGILEDARLIRAQVERCRRILDRLTALDQEQLGPSPEPLPVERLVTVLREDQGQSDRFEVEVAPGVEPEPGVPPDVAHALQPLLKNAIDAAGEAGSVTLRISQPDGQWQFVVRDDGPGMPDEIRARALEPFFTTKEHGRGMGLGLYLAKLVADRHGGRLGIVSEAGRGTTATLVVPRRGRPGSAG